MTMIEKTMMMMIQNQRMMTTMIQSQRIMTMMSQSQKMMTMMIQSQRMMTTMIQSQKAMMAALFVNDWSASGVRGIETRHNAQLVYACAKAAKAAN